MDLGAHEEESPLSSCIQPAPAAQDVCKFTIDANYDHRSIHLRHILSSHYYCISLLGILQILHGNAGTVSQRLEWPIIHSARS